MNNSEETLEILFKDEYYVAINKPHGLMVHNSKLASFANEFAIQRLRDQLGQRVFPAHRIDRKTSGVLLFALSKEALVKIRSLFEAHEIEKTYLSILRGHTEFSGLIDYPLRSENGRLKEAQTNYKTLAHSEIEIPLGKHNTSRYSLVEAKPITGRMHQLRKHFAHIFHPIIGDRPHGCSKQNKLFKEKWEMSSMLLHASTLEFIHPYTKEQLHIKATPSSEFKRMLKTLKFDSPND